MTTRHDYIKKKNNNNNNLGKNKYYFERTLITI